MPYNPEKMAYMEERNYCNRDPITWVYTFNCYECRQPFQSKCNHAKWCSYECYRTVYLRDRKERQELARHKVCLHCKKDFIGTRSDAKYCSHSCRQLEYVDGCRLTAQEGQPLRSEERRV